jgi:transcription initiation factor TFIIB
MIFGNDPEKGVGGMIVGEKDPGCFECQNDGTIMDHAAGELICEGCGLVVNSIIIDYSREWRAYNPIEHQKRSRVGLPSSLTFHNKGLSTDIDPKNRDFSGRRLNPDQRAQAYRLKKWQRRSQVSGSSDRNLISAMSELTKVTYKLHLPRNVLETAAYIYRLAIKKGLSRGRSIRGMVAACLYIACRQCNVIRHLGEVAEATQISKRDVWRIYRLLIRNLETPVPRVQSPRYISKYMSQLSLTGDAEGIAIQILETAAKLKLLNGRNPASMAAAATYIACRITGESRTQEQIAQVGRITDVTIRNRYKELFGMIQISLNV